MMVGLFFFIRASTKDRTESLTLHRPDTPATVRQQLIQHFEERAYTVQTNDPSSNQVELQGIVRPSLFLAIFLTTLALIGLLCLALVLASLFPGLDLVFPGLIGLSPVAGLYYWQRARREETIKFQVSPAVGAAKVELSQVVITAHRDELIALQQALKTQ